MTKDQVNEWRQSFKQILEKQIDPKVLVALLDDIKSGQIRIENGVLRVERGIGEIKTSIRPRRLSTHDQEVIAIAMAPFRRNGDHLITAFMNDAASITYAMDFKAAFRAAGWQFTGAENGVHQAAFTGVPRGVIVIARSHEDFRLSGVQAFGSALRQIGIPLVGEMDPNMTSGEFRIIVGAKPE
jgi:hypothetical protein